MLASRLPIIDEKAKEIRLVTLGIQEACESFHVDEKMPQIIAEKFGHKYALLPFFEFE